MRPLACLAILMPGLSACAQIPDAIRVEVDGSTVEYKKKPEPAEPAEPAPIAPDDPER